MVYMIFVDGQLRAVNTDKTDASILANELLQQREGELIRVVAVNGHIHEELHVDDKEES